MLLGVLVFYVVSNLAWLLIGSEEDAAQKTQEVVHATLAIVWSLRIVFFNILVPDAPSHRVLDLDDDHARALDRALMTQVGISAVIGALCAWMDALGLSQNAHLLALIMGSALGAALLSWVLVRHRRAITVMALGPVEDIKVSL